jgi:hypothetical protein
MSETNNKPPLRPWTADEILAWQPSADIDGYAMHHPEHGWAIHPISLRYDAERERTTREMCGDDRWAMKPFRMVEVK